MHILLLQGLINVYLYVKLHLHIITLPEDQLNIFRKRVRESVQYEFQPFPGSRGFEHTFIERH